MGRGHSPLAKWRFVHTDDDGGVEGCGTPPACEVHNSTNAVPVEEEKADCREARKCSQCITIQRIKEGVLTLVAQKRF